MSVNSSSHVLECWEMWYIQVGFSLTSLLLLPLPVFVLGVGLQRWRRRGSTAAMSHSDVFTYNMAATELVGLLEHGLTLGGIFAGLRDVLLAGTLVGSFLWYGQTIFPILTCVDRYLAVVHPVAYLRLRQGGGVRLRNAVVALSWVQGASGPVFVVLSHHYPEYSLVPSGCQMVLFLGATLFCSLSVLRVLARPRPGGGEAGGTSRIHRSKRTALRTIVVILGVLSVRFGGTLISSVVFSSPTASWSLKCLVLTGLRWFGLPSSLVLPLLFLHRAGKLPGCRPRAGPPRTPGHETTGA